MDGRRREREPRGGSVGAVFMTPCASGTMLSNFFKRGSGRGHRGGCANAFIIGRIWDRRVLLGLLVWFDELAWPVTQRSQGKVQSRAHPSCFLRFSPGARIVRSDAVISSFPSLLSPFVSVEQLTLRRVTPQ